MPVDFLTPEQERRYGRDTAEPAPEHLARSFHLDDADRRLLAERRGDHNRLGFALQLCTVRFLGTFLEDPTDVPPGVVAPLAAQLGTAELGELARSREGEARWDHAAAIRQAGGYRDFHEQPEHFRLVRWLSARAWSAAERPSLLFDLATARLVERRILLPGVSVLVRLVARVRERATAGLWRRLSHAPTAAQRQQLEALLVVPEGARQTPLDRLRRAPTRSNASALVDALRRLREIRALGVGALDRSALPAGQLKALARYAMTARAQALARMPEPRRVATLLAFAHQLEAAAQDDALDLLDRLLTQLLARADRAGQQTRLRTLRGLDAAALCLRDACAVVLNLGYRDGEVREQIFTRLSEAQLAQAVAVVEELARPADDGEHYDAELPDRYAQVRRFLPLLLETVVVQAAAAGRTRAPRRTRERRGRGSRCSGSSSPGGIASRPASTARCTPDGRCIWTPTGCCPATPTRTAMSWSGPGRTPGWSATSRCGGRRRGASRTERRWRLAADGTSIGAGSGWTASLWVTGGGGRDGGVMADTSVTKVEARHSPSGKEGQRYLASGIYLSMRLWQERPPGEVKPVRRRDYETVGYVLSGRAELYLEGQMVLLEPGNAWVVPKGAAHSYKVLEPFTAVEATAPPAEVHGRDERSERPT